MRSCEQEMQSSTHTTRRRDAALASSQVCYGVQWDSRSNEEGTHVTRRRRAALASVLPGTTPPPCAAIHRKSRTYRR